MYNLDDLVNRVETAEVRTLVSEAQRCHSVGANRAAISLTWTAVCTDIIEKISRLAEDGYGEAAKVAAAIEAARSESQEAAAIQKIQAIERELLDNAVSFELIEPIEKQQLERLRTDRNLSSHPSYRLSGEAYEPTQEYARAHLVTALDVLLTHTHTQGGKVLDRFRSHVQDPYFTGDVQHLQRTYFDRVRKVTQGRLVELSVKHALAELPVPGENPSVIAERMALCVRAFVQRDYDLVASKILKAIDPFRIQSGDVQLRGLARVGDLDVFWDSVDAPLAGQLDTLVSGLCPDDPAERLGADAVAVFGLLTAERPSSRLPSFQATFDKLSTQQKLQVISSFPSTYFSPYCSKLVADASSFREAERVAAGAVLTCAPYMSAADLGETLEALALNGQARNANGMAAHLIELYTASRHLEWEDVRAWRDFFSIIERLESEGSPYRYPEIKIRLGQVYGEGWEAVE